MKFYKLERYCQRFDWDDKYPRLLEEAEDIDGLSIYVSRPILNVAKAGIDETDIIGSLDDSNEFVSSCAIAINAQTIDTCDWCTQAVVTSATAELDDIVSSTKVGN